MPQGGGSGEGGLAQRGYGGVAQPGGNVSSGVGGDYGYAGGAARGRPGFGPVGGQVAAAQAAARNRGAPTGGGIGINAPRRATVRAVNPVTGQAITTYADTLPAGFQVVPAGYTSMPEGWQLGQDSTLALDEPMGAGMWDSIIGMPTSPAAPQSWNKGQSQISPAAPSTMHNHSGLGPGLEVNSGPETPSGSLGGDQGSFGGNQYGGQRQYGGPVKPGQRYTVGENGPETFQPMGFGGSGLGLQGVLSQLRRRTA